MVAYKLLGTHHLGLFRNVSLMFKLVSTNEDADYVLDQSFTYFEIVGN